MCLFIAIFRMFTIWQMSLEGVNNMSSFIHKNISNVYCFAYTICAPLYRYVKCLLFRIYSRVGVNNMCTFIQQYLKCSLFRISVSESGRTICALLCQYVKCLLFRIYSGVRVNNMCIFIQQYFKCL